jgi:hypothetical protein
MPAQGKKPKEKMKPKKAIYRGPRNEFLDAKNREERKKKEKLVRGYEFMKKQEEKKNRKAFDQRKDRDTLPNQIEKSEAEGWSFSLRNISTLQFA